jgi:hypothetical protein
MIIFRARVWFVRVVVERIQIVGVLIAAIFCFVVFVVVLFCVRSIICSGIFGLRFREAILIVWLHLLG